MFFRTIGVNRIAASNVKMKLIPLLFIIIFFGTSALRRLFNCCHVVFNMPCLTLTGTVLIFAIDIVKLIFVAQKIIFFLVVTRVGVQQ